MHRPELLKRVLRDCYCRLQPSDISGVGVFAIRTIPRGVDPFKTLPKYRPGYVRITEEEIGALPCGLSGLVRALFVPTEGKMYVPTCGLNIIYIGAYINHSNRPNMRTKDGCTFVTQRRIRVGEELTVDYRTYGAEAAMSAL